MTSYYVDKTTGADGDDGESPGNAWETINKVNISSFNANDSILFKRGETWRETLTVPSSGTSGNPITFGAYSTGNLPILNGADLVTGWSLYAGSTYQKTWANSRVVVIEDGTRLDIGSDKDSLNASEFVHDTGELYVRCSDDADPDTHTMEVSVRTIVVFSNGQDYITFQDINLKYARGLNVDVQGSNDLILDRVTSDSPLTIHVETRTTACGSLTIRNCTLNDAGNESIYLLDDFITSGTVLIENNTINCSFWEGVDNGDGIDIKSGQLATILVRNNTIDLSDCPYISVNDSWGIIVNSPATIENNTIINPVSAGIQTGTGAVGTIIRYNKITISQAGSNHVLHGIRPTSDDTQVYYNLCIFTGGTSSDAYGLHFSGNDRDNCDVFNNVFVGFKRGLVSTGDLTNCQVKNNIFYEYTINGIHLGTPTSLVCDNNDVYTTQGGTNYGYYGGANRADLAAWQAATPYGDNSIEDDPVFTNPASDWTLQPSSPCRDVGVDVSLTRDYAGVAVPQETNPAIGAYEYPTLSVSISPDGNYIQIA